MHIPDGFINGSTSLGAGAVAAAGVGVSLRRAGKVLADKQVPLAGLAAAFIFAAQMINFPVGAGTSGHLIGGGLAAVLLGPWMATVVMTVVVSIQALLFADGGISALGLNVLNMAIIAPWTAWFVYKAVRSVLPRTHRSVVAATGIASMLSVVVAALGFVAEYAIGGSGGVAIRTVLLAMGGVHTLIGIGEGLITGAVVSAVLAVRADIVYGAADLGVSTVPRLSLARFVVAGIGVAVVVAALLSPFASSSPDGLERVALDQGFADTAQVTPVEASPLAGYGLAGVGSEPVATAIAGIAGVAVTFGVGYGIVRLRRRHKVDR